MRYLPPAGSYVEIRRSGVWGRGDKGGGAAWAGRKGVRVGREEAEAEAEAKGKEKWAVRVCLSPISTSPITTQSPIPLNPTFLNPANFTPSPHTAPNLSLDTDNSA